MKKMRKSAATLQVIRGDGIQHDRSISKAIEKSTDKPTDRFDLLFESAHDAIIVIETKSRNIMRINQAALELTGYLRSEIENQSVSIFYPQDHVIADKSIGRSNPLSDLHIDSSGFFEDVMIARKDGYPRFVGMSVKNSVLTEGRKIVPVAMCILRDVTEKKTMERDLITKHTELREAFIQLEKKNAELKSMQETLVQSGKLAALGELAAGIAHELNQPLTAVKGFAQESKSAIGVDNKVSAIDCIEEVIKGADKMQKIISHLRNFTRKSTEDFEWCNVHSIIDESMVMLDKQFKGRGIEVIRRYDPDLPKVFCNPFQLEQVFINFSTNARDAIEAQIHNSAGMYGKIEITTRKVSEQMIEVQFKDNGCGIPEVVKSKIFNPFFTTKEVGKGMGLGLSISYGILERIHASIVVESSQGSGTTFKINLPVDYREH